MSADAIPFRRGALRPMQCLSEGYELAKSDYWNLFLITFLGMLVGGIVPVILLGPMMCGISMCFLRARRGRKPNIELLFKGFDYFMQSLIGTMILVVPMIVISIVMYVLLMVGMIASMPKPGPGGNAAPPGAALGAGMLGLFFAFYAVIFVLSMVMWAVMVFMYPLIVDRKLSGVDAFMTSLKAVLGNLSGMFVFMLLMSLVYFVGALACCIGAYFTMPIIAGAGVVAYEQVFPDDAEEYQPDSPYES